MSLEIHLLVHTCVKKYAEQKALNSLEMASQLLWSVEHTLQPSPPAPLLHMHILLLAKLYAWICI